MRRTVTIKWFIDCLTIDEAKMLYRELVKQHHPDRGGSLKTMQEINAEWTYIKANPSAIPTRARDGYERHKYASSKKSSYSSSNTDSSRYKSVYLEPGDYVVKIIDIKDNEEKKYVALVFDIMETGHRNYFAFKPWYKHCVYLKYEKDWQIRNTHRIINVISQSNHDFDGWTEFANDKTYKFIGKQFGLHISQEYINGGGFINCEDVFVI